MIGKMKRDEVRERIHAHLNGELYKIAGRNYIRAEACSLASLLIDSNLLPRGISIAVGKAREYIRNGVSNSTIYAATLENALKAAQGRGFKLPERF